MTKRRILLLAFGAAVIALIILLTALRADKDITRDNKDTTRADKDTESLFPMTIGPPENQQTEATEDGDTLDNREGNVPDHVIARKIGATRITLRTPEELAAFLENVDMYYELSKLFSQEDVPALMALLENPKYVRSWGAAMIIAASVDKQQESQPHLIRFLKTDFSRALNDFRGIHVKQNTRITALVMLGHVADERGIEFLETIALSNEGLYSVTGKWIHKPSATNFVLREQYIARLRAMAALGLVYSQNPSSIAKIDKLRLETIDTLQTVLQSYNLVEPSNDEWIEAFNSKESILMHLQLELIDTLSVRDAIEEIGMDEYRTAVDQGTMGTLGVIGDHMDKYEMY